MFSLWLLLLLTLLPVPRVHNLAIIETDDATANVAAALQTMIPAYYAPLTKSFMVSVHVKQHRLAWLANDFLDQLLRRLDMIKVEIENVNATRVEFNRFYNLLVVDGLEALEELNPASLTRNYDFPEFYFVYLARQTPSVVPLSLINEMFKYFWRHYILNVSLLFASESDIVQLFTYFAFSNPCRCQKVSVQQINTFHNGWDKHIDGRIFPDKLHNLHNCPLKATVWHIPPFLNYFPNETGFNQIGGFEGQLLTELARKLNFSLEFIEPANNEQRGVRLANGSTTGAMKMLIERTADMSLGYFRYTAERSQVLTGAVPFYQASTGFSVLLTSRPYSPIEILAFAFDNPTWLSLCMSLLATFIVAFISYTYSRRSRLAYVIMGTPASATPLTNLFGVFLGVPVVKAPHTNFTRFVVVLWFLYGILIRTAYQSLLFKLLQTNLYRKPPETLAELIEAGYALIMTRPAYQGIWDGGYLRDDLIEVIVVDSREEDDQFLYMERSNNKLLASVSGMDLVTYHMNIADKRGTFFVLPEKLFTQLLTIYFTKHFYLIERFNVIFMQLRSQGLINYWASLSIGEHFAMENIAVVDALDYEDLSGAFIIFNVLLGVAGLVFCFELIFGRFNRFQRKNSKSSPI